MRRATINIQQHQEYINVAIGEMVSSPIGKKIGEKHYYDSSRREMYFSSIEDPINKAKYCGDATLLGKYIIISSFGDCYINWYWEDNSAVLSFKQKISEFPDIQCDFISVANIRTLMIALLFRKMDFDIISEIGNEIYGVKNIHETADNILLK